LAIYIHGVASNNCAGGVYKEISKFYGAAGRSRLSCGFQGGFSKITKSAGAF